MTLRFISTLALFSFMAATPAFPGQVGKANSVYRMGASSKVPQFGSVDLSQTNAVGASILGATNGGTGLSSSGSNGNLLVSTGSAWQSVPPSTAFSLYPETIQNFTSSATYYPSFIFVVTAANATAGATYTNNGVTFTVSQTIAGVTLLLATEAGSATPLSSGTLTKATGTGDATITYSKYVHQPLYLKIYATAGGGGGGGGANGSNNAGTSAAGTGGNTSFDAIGGYGGAGGGPGTYSSSGLAWGGQGGCCYGAAGWPVYCVCGAGGGSAATVVVNNACAGGEGGSSFFGGGGGAGSTNGGGQGSVASGGGGGGGGGYNGTGGGGGGGGGTAVAYKYFPATTGYTVTIGGGGGATCGQNCGSGGAGGEVVVEEHWQ